MGKKRDEKKTPEDEIVLKKEAALLLSTRLKNARKARGLSIMGLATRVCVSTKTIKNGEAGLIVPLERNLGKLIKVLKLHEKNTLNLAKLARMRVKIKNAT